MLDGSAPITRLSATELLPGCTNCTDSPALMPKLCQLMTTFGVGWAWTPAPQAIIRETARIFRLKQAWPPAAEVQDDIFLPALRVFSETATKVPVWSFQMER